MSGSGCRVWPKFGGRKELPCRLAQKVCTVPEQDQVGTTTVLWMLMGQSVRGKPFPWMNISSVLSTVCSALGGALTSTLRCQPGRQEWMPLPECDRGNDSFISRLSFVTWHNFLVPGCWVMWQLYVHFLLQVWEQCLTGSKTLHQTEQLSSFLFLRCAGLSFSFGWWGAVTFGSFCFCRIALPPGLAVHCFPHGGWKSKKNFFYF